MVWWKIMRQQNVAHYADLTKICQIGMWVRSA
jgi:hypothetical protein